MKHFYRMIFCLVISTIHFCLFLSLRQWPYLIIAIALLGFAVWSCPPVIKAIVHKEKSTLFAQTVLYASRLSGLGNEDIGSGVATIVKNDINYFVENKSATVFSLDSMRRRSTERGDVSYVIYYSYEAGKAAFVFPRGEDTALVSFVKQG